MLENLLLFVSSFFISQVRARNIAYNDVSRLDVYKPDTKDTGLPVVVFWYGGSWKKGSKEQYRFVADGVARSAHCIVIVADYALSPAQKFPGFIDEAWDVVAWAQNHAADYGGDPANITVMGHSAGAHTAAMVFTGYRKPAGIQPVKKLVGVSGPYAFLVSYWRFLFGDALATGEAFPTNHVQRIKDPRTSRALLVHGRFDGIVYPRQTTLFADRLQEAGVPTRALRTMNGHMLVLLRFASPFARFTATSKYLKKFVSNDSHAA